MRKIILSFAIVAMSAFALTLSSCSTELGVEGDESAVVVVAARAAEAPTVDYCGEPKVVRLLAGQNIDAGSVTVGNDTDSLYVTYKTTGDWYMKTLHLYVGDCDKLPVNKQGNLNPGQFDKVPGQFGIQVPFSPYQTMHRIAVALKDLPECFCIAAHADVVKVVNGKVVQSETAFGEGEKTGKNWFMKFDYCVQECPPEEPPTDCWQEETGWADGPRYVETGSWAMYTPLFKDDVLWGPLNSPVNIYAGNPKNNPVIAGTVEFAWSTTEANRIIVTITLQDGWELIDDDESVKMNGYDPAPSGNPDIGNFKYKGTSLTWTIPVCRYLGIHLDLRKKIDCPPVD